MLAPPQSLRDASCATPGFLRLPREIRDMIYDYIFVDVCVSTPDSRSSSDAEQGRGWHPKIELLNTTAPALLRVNKQISGEYCERMRPAAVLKIHVWSSDIHHPQGLPIQARVPMEAISAAKQCHLPIVWDYLITSDNIQRYGRWFRDCLPEQLAKQETLWWTPSKRKLHSPRYRVSHWTSLTFTARHSRLTPEVSFDCASLRTSRRHARYHIHRDLCATCRRHVLSLQHARQPLRSRICGGGKIHAKRRPCANYLRSRAR